MLDARDGLGPGAGMHVLQILREIFEEWDNNHSAADVGIRHQNIEGS